MPDNPNEKVPPFGEGGWFWLSEEGQELAKRLASRNGQDDEELSAAYDAVFSSPLGQIVYRDLQLKTVEQPTWVPDLPNPEQNGYAREGQNSLFRYIRGRIIAARNRKPQEG